MNYQLIRETHWYKNRSILGHTSLLGTWKIRTKNPLKIQGKHRPCKIPAIERPQNSILVQWRFAVQHSLGIIVCFNLLTLSDPPTMQRDQENQENAYLNVEEDNCIESSEDGQIDIDSKENAGRWTTEEHELFLEGLRLHGKGWKKIAQYIKSRSVIQVRTHAQKYFLKMAKAKQSGILGEVSMDGRTSSITVPKKRPASEGPKRPTMNKTLSKSEGIVIAPGAPSNPLFSFNTSGSATALTIGIADLKYENMRSKLDDNISCISPSSITGVDIDQNQGIYRTQQQLFNHQSQGGVYVDGISMSMQMASQLSQNQPVSHMVTDNELLLYPMSNDVEINFDLFCNLHSLSDSQSLSWDSKNERKRMRIDDEANSSYHSDIYSVSCSNESSSQNFSFDFLPDVDIDNNILDEELFNGDLF
eukprot:gene12809-27011_t